MALGAVIGDRPLLLVALTPDAVSKGLSAGKIAGAAARIMGGVAGAVLTWRSRGKDAERLGDALDAVYHLVAEGWANESSRQRCRAEVAGQAGGTMALLSRRGRRPDAPATMTHHTAITWERVTRTAVLRLTDGTGRFWARRRSRAGCQSYEPPRSRRWYAACDRALAQSEDMTQRLAGRKIVPD